MFMIVCCSLYHLFFFSSRRRHTRCALVTGVQTCALPISFADSGEPVRLVTGLPISFFRKHREALTALLQNRHALTIVKPNGEREEKTLNIERDRKRVG